MSRCILRAPKSGAYTRPDESEDGREKMVGADDRSVGSTYNKQRGALAPKRKKKKKKKEKTNHPPPPKVPILICIQPPFQRHPLPLPELKLITRAFVGVIHDRQEAEADVGGRLGGGGAVFGHLEA